MSVQIIGNSQQQNIELRVLSALHLDSSNIDKYVLDEKLFLYEVHRMLFNSIVDYHAKYPDVTVISFVSLWDYGYFKNVHPKDINYIACAMDNFETHLLKSDLKFLNNAYHEREVLRISNMQFDTPQEREEEVASIPNFFIDVEDKEMDVDEIFQLVTKKEQYLQFKKLEFMKSFEFYRNTLNIVGARPGVGKTSLSMNMLNDLSDRYYCIYINLENREDMMHERLIMMNTGFSQKRIKACVEKGHDKDRQVVSDAIYSIKRKGIKLMDYNKVKTIEDVKTVVKQESENQLCVVFIDNINDLKTYKKFNTLREQMNYITKELLEIKATCNCIIFALAQVKRSETQSRPTDRDLKESGSIEEDADNVILIHTKDSKEEKYPTYEIYNEKARSQGNFTVYAIFDKQVQTFRGKANG